MGKWMPKGLPEEIPAAKRKLGKSATTCVCGGGEPLRCRIIVLGMQHFQPASPLPALRIQGKSHSAECPVSSFSLQNFFVSNMPHLLHLRSSLRAKLHRKSSTDVMEGAEPIDCTPLLKDPLDTHSKAASNVKWQVAFFFANFCKFFSGFFDSFVRFANVKLTILKPQITGKCLCGWQTEWEGIWEVQGLVLVLS